MTLTEWELQDRLTRLWLRDGVEIGGDRQMLVAWEVMTPSWGINDAHGKFDEPSIDFLVVDRSGRLMAVELKRVVPGIRPAWRALCQVTHRAVLLERTFSPDRLEGAYRACATGTHGRVGRGEVQSLADRHREFFGLGQSLRLGEGGFRRAVAATGFGPSWPSVLAEFNRLDWSDLVHRLSDQGELRQGAIHREPRRLRDLPPPARAELVGPVCSLSIAMAAAIA